MIRDDKRGLFTRVLELYVRRKVKRAFRGLWVRGGFPATDAGLIVYANHSSFWDGFIVHQLGQLGGWDGYAMMEEENLAKYRFHTRIGAFGIKRGDPHGALQTLRHAKALLARPKAAVIIFPEGKLHAGQGAPKPFERGIEVLARASKARVVPCAIRYAFLENEFPDVLVQFGTPHEGAELNDFERRLTAAHASLAAVTSTEGFECVLPGRTSVQQRWDTVRRLPAATER